VFWYPWGEEAFRLAREQNLPIFLSIGYSTCYWCHVMEREVFENVSIASLMNKSFINVKVDREEHPALDDIYMIARQIMTQEGGWPNNLFLTPGLKPFYAGGTFAPTDTYGKPAFPRVLEWITDEWATKQQQMEEAAEEISGLMHRYLQRKVPAADAPLDIPEQAHKLFGVLKSHYDARNGGFYQAPKFPHENYLQFLLNYYTNTGDALALEMVTVSLRRMAAGGLNDQVGAGFHRYAVDKQWYVPHFEKMLYTQALLARSFTDAARLSKSILLADVAMSILDFVSGPLTDSTGAFYSAIDAENEGIEGVFYAWSAEEIQQVLLPEEAEFFVRFFALADIPTYPGHMQTPGKVIIARMPLDMAARDHGMPYVQMAALAGQLLNKLLARRNQREMPGLDNKIIVAWNGLMIDAYAHAGRVFGRGDYVNRAKQAADYLLEHAIDNNGNLQRIIANGRAHLPATLEDYAYLIRGLISLYHAAPTPQLLETVESLCAAVEALFGGPEAGYYFTQSSDALWLRIKTGDDSALPNPNAVMLQSWLELYQITNRDEYRDKASVLTRFFLAGNQNNSPELATMLSGAMLLYRLIEGMDIPGVIPFALPDLNDSEQVQVMARLLPDYARPGQVCELELHLTVREGWHINAGSVAKPNFVGLQVTVAEGAEVLELAMPEPTQKIEMGEFLKVYEGEIAVKAKVKLPVNREVGQAKTRLPIRIMLRFQPCNGTACYPVQDLSLSV